MNKISIIGDISTWNESSKYLRYRTKDISGDLEVEISSYGGDVFEGIEMFNILREYSRTKGKVTTIVNGKAMSIASLIMLAGDIRKAYSNSTIMIHKSWTWLSGNADDLANEAKILSGIDMIMLKEYSKYMKESKDEIEKMMSDEAWFIGEEQIVESGLISEIINVDEETKETQANFKQAMRTFNARAESREAKPDLNKVAKSIKDCNDGKCIFTENNTGGNNAAIPDTKLAKLNQGDNMTQEEIDALSLQNKVLSANATTFKARNETLKMQLEDKEKELLAMKDNFEAKLSEGIKAKEAEISAKIKEKFSEQAESTLKTLNARVVQMQDKGVLSAETFKAISAVENDTEASKIILDAKPKTNAIHQGEGDENDMSKSMMAYAISKKGSIS